MKKIYKLIWGIASAIMIIGITIYFAKGFSMLLDMTNKPEIIMFIAILAICGIREICYFLNMSFTLIGEGTQKKEDV